MLNEEKESSPCMKEQCDEKCSECEQMNAEAKKAEQETEEALPPVRIEKMPNGEKVVAYKKEPTLTDVAKMIEADESFIRATKGSKIVATRILAHSNGQDSVLQIFFHRNIPAKILMTTDLPKV